MYPWYCGRSTEIKLLDGIGAEQLDHVIFYEKPLVKFERLLETYISYAPREMDRALGGRYKGRYVFCEHHESHAASAFFPSPFEEAAILTLDGVGEWATGKSY